MTPTQSEALRQDGNQAQSASHTWFHSSTETVKKLVVDHPGAVLVISAGIGVLVGCLIKRR
jgi:ElaB/YqjD/DUF883 family membrane-anchored ribosome-binding protein